MELSSHLQDSLTEILRSEPSPAATTIQALGQVAQDKQWHKLPSDLSIPLKKLFESDPQGFIQNISRLTTRLESALATHADHKLERFGQLNVPLGNDLYWIQQALDPDGFLLQVGIARSLIDIIFEATRRAKTFSNELVVGMLPSEGTVNQYLQEAYDCYLFGLYASCSVMCRSVLEELLKKRIPPEVRKRWAQEVGKKPPHYGMSFNDLLSKAQKATPEDGDLFPYLQKSEFFKLSGRIRVGGNSAAHGQSANEKQARETLKDTRKALSLLLGNSYSSSFL